MKTKAKLAVLLGVTKTELVKISKSTKLAGSGAYKEWETRPKFPNSKHPALVHKSRKIQEPVGLLRDVQDRASQLLSRINLPEYLHSARKGHSYRTNAAVHDGPGCAFRIDIKRFYESAQDTYVQRFFLERLECSPDVAHILTEITCFRRRLPTGSPLSPLISYFAYAAMFDRLAELANSVGARMTVYVDDVVFSGTNVTGDLIPACVKIMRDFELIGHKILFYSLGEERVVTGLSVSPSGIGVTNKRKRKLRALLEERALATDPEDKKLYTNSLIGLLRESGSIDPAYLPLARKFEMESRATTVKA
ncbi:reverse transcriptase family protein [Hydrocarboniphaga effusa]|uniref:reverse transcriptase family protein n=1 Tax=Hydrocarboniphaga effusa TaxID=243629 RepID=UPI00398BC6F7